MRTPKLLLLSLLLALVTSGADAARPRKKAAPARPRTSAEARSQRKKAEKELQATSRELTETQRELSTSLRRISSLEESIARSSRRADRLKQRMDSIARRTALVKDSIAANEAELARLRELYTKAVRSSRKNRREMNSLTFIFSAETFRQAWRRMRYLEQYSEWRKRKTVQIDAVVAALSAQKEDLEEMQRRTAALRTEALTEERKLRADRSKLETLAGSLKGRTKELNVLLKRQQSTLQQLDDEIDRLIAREEAERRAREEAERRKREAEEAKRRAAKAAEAAEAAAKGQPAPPKKQPAKPAEPQKPKDSFSPSEAAKNAAGSFAAQKGKLPSPLSHTYVVALGFGRQQHRSVSNLEVNNPGVDLETALGATARAIFPGTVSAVFVQDGLGHVVLVRHGDYLTVYANIKTLNVKKGQTLKAGDVIGTVGPGDVNPNRAQLHFEIRHEREKLDPRLWLKR